MFDNDWFERDDRRERDRVPAPDPVADEVFVVDGVRKCYRQPNGVPAIALDLSRSRLTIGPGLIALLAPSGTGKSTLLSILGGLDVPTEGEVIFAGRPLPSRDGPDMAEHRAANVSQVFQAFNLIGHLSARDNVAMPMIARGMTRSEACEEAERFLIALNLTPDERRRKPAALSGGQQQRVGIARAFAAQTPVILADEPTGQLDPITGEEIVRQFADLAHRFGRTVIMATHNEYLALQYADRIIRLIPGTGKYEMEEGNGALDPRAVRPRRMPSPTPNDTRRGMTLRNKLWFALSDLKHRRVVSGITSLVVMIAACYGLFIGFCGERIDKAQQKQFEDAVPNRMIAQARNAANPNARFTADRIAELRRLDGVQAIVPWIEFRADASCGSHSESILVNSTTPDDPGIGPNRLVWGRSVGRGGAAEVVLARGLFERLGGRLRASGPAPAEVCLQISRSGGGRTESRVIKAAIAGLLAHDNPERVYLSLHHVEQASLWLQSKLPDPSGSDDKALTYPNCVAFASPAHAERVNEELAHYRLQAGKPDSVTVVTSSGPVWATLDPSASKAALDRVAAFPGTTIHEVMYLKLKNRTVAALADGDPRWRQLGITPAQAFGKIWGRDGLPLPDGFHAGADVICSRDTLERSRFQPRSEPARQVSFIQTSDLETMRLLADRVVDHRAVDRDRGWLMLMPPPRGSGLLMDREVARLGAQDIDAVRVQKTKVEIVRRGDSQTLSFNLPVAVAPAAWLQKLFATPARSTRPVAVYVTADRTIAPDRLWIGDREMSLSVTDGPEEMLWMSDTDWSAMAPKIGAAPHRLAFLDEAPAESRTGWLAAGRWTDLLTIVRMARDHQWGVWQAWSRLPESLTVLVDGTGGELRLPPRTTTIVPAWAIEARVAGLASPIRVISEKDLEGSPLSSRLSGMIRLAATDSESRKVTCRAGSRDWSLPLWPDRSLPRGVAVVDESTFADMAFEAAGRQSGVSDKPVIEVCFSDALAFDAAQRQLRSMGSTITPRTDLNRRELLVFTVTKGGKPIAPDVVGLLKSSPPTFEGAYPGGTLAMTVGSHKAECVCSDARDPRRFARPLRAGGWLKPDSHMRQIVLPKGMAETLGAAPGRTVEVSFAGVSGDRDDMVRIPMDVAGITDDAGSAVVPVALFDAVVGWQRRQLEFNEATLSFESPAERALRNGYVRCAIYAQSRNAVGPLEQTLKHRFQFDVESKLAEMEHLARMQRTLLGVVLFLVLGGLLMAGLVTGLGTTQHIQQKTWEIGVLRALGVSRREVMGLFVIEALLLGVVGFGCAFAAFVAGEAWLRRVAAEALQLPAATFCAGGPLDRDAWWLSLTVLAICIGSTVLGVLVPAIRAARLTPAEALRRRDG
jgi:ABC-type lipoprotein export system ATPase subunit